MFISLWTVPLVLHALGASDYGIFNLVIGVVAMLSFINGAMTVSTQRYLSVTLAKNDNYQLNKIFNGSLVLHLTIALIIVILFEIAAPFLFSGQLNIPVERQKAAQIVFQCLILNLFLTIISVPFDATLNAYENMLAYSIISIIEALLKLALAFSLSYWLTGDLLVFYGIGLLVVTLITVLMKIIYTLIKYRVLRVSLVHFFDKKIFYEMFGFAGWNTFGAMAGVGRTQGIAIILNLFYGTIINAAYGIANQVNGVLNYFSTTIQKSINPQLMQQEGCGNRTQMVRYAHISSKYSNLMIGMLAIPLFIEAPYVLRLWLHDLPDNTIIFVRLILIMAVINQFSAGIMSAFQATGRIKVYQLVVGSLLLINIPIGYFLLKYGLPAYSILISAIIVDIIALICRLIIANITISDFNCYNFITRIIIPNSVLLVICTICLYYEKMLMQESFIRLIVICLSSVVLICVPTYLLLMDNVERNKINHFFKIRHE